ncbi:MAG: 4Fe-4S binding protein [Candidatus Bathyarchaeota archaeon]|nr:MAG: 4Fe-4S binding protein [Candidatus Bathyarchaeota archaeon]
MKIDEGNCTRCRSCIIYCPVSAIKTGENRVLIDQDLCVECGVCLKSGACKFDALHQPPLEWPRILRSQFSDPLISHPSTGIMGRGTAEMKTNDVTGRFRLGEVGFAIEMGRPGISTSMVDVEKVFKALIGEVEFEPLNPVTYLFDLEEGEFRDPRVRGERALSAIIECKTTEENGVRVLNILREVSEEIDTVFTLCVVNRCRDHEIPFKRVMEEEGFTPRINGKTNVGLGRPLA